MICCFFFTASNYMLITYMWSLNCDVKSTIKANMFMLCIWLQWMKPLNNALLTSVFPHGNRLIPFILVTSAQYKPRFERKNKFPNYFLPRRQWIITYITLWHITIMFNFWWNKWGKKRMIQYKRSETVSTRQTVLLSVLIINSKAINLCWPDNKSKHNKKVDKLCITWYLKQIKLSWQATALVPLK